MNIKSIVLSILFAISTCATMSAQQDYTKSSAHTTPQNYMGHLVRNGETVYSIATTYRTTTDKIYQLNPTAKEGIRVGEILLVPYIDKSEIVKTPSSGKGYTPSDDRIIRHIIESKETLFGISKKYDVKIEDIAKLNPGLNETTFKVGSVILVPNKKGVKQKPDEPTTIIKEYIATPRDDYKKPVTKQPEKIVNVSSTSSYPQTDSNITYIEHKVGEQETLYGLSKTWNVTISELVEFNPSLKQEGLKKGTVIRIPRYEDRLSQIFEEKEHKFVRIGLFLPFLEENGSIGKEKIKEYYEGFLLAVQDAKNSGLNAEIYTFDAGPEKNTHRLESILETNEAQSLSVVIGGVSKEQIKVLSKFSKDKRIKYVVPFGSLSSSELKGNPFLFQATNSHSNLYNVITNSFNSLFANDKFNIIFLEEAKTQRGNREELTDLLKKQLMQKGVRYKEIAATSDLTSELEEKFNKTEGIRNVIVPSSSNEATLRKLINSLKELESNGTANNNITLFGHPEWQIYTSYLNSFYKYDTYIYSMFYFDANQARTRSVDERYKTWYGRRLVNSYPKYAHLGYDMGLFFLTALREYGNDFESRAFDISVPTLQSATRYNRIDGNGGYINTALYLIHYKPNLTVEKVEYSK